ncbi:MAG: exopolysaccharide biosynthesis polyprenyl glycosylphosphotransferase [Patescibacteria group bacterium]
MAVTNKNEALLLFFGDVLVFFLSLWLMIFVRFREAPDVSIFLDHVAPFSIIFVLWFAVFFIAGLYEKHTLILKNRIPAIILNAQLVNSGLAVVFFYLVPYFGITPKTNLFIYIVISFGLILFWRIRGVSILSAHAREKAVLIGSGEEAKELKNEVNNNPRYGLYFVSSINSGDIKNADFREEISRRILEENVHIVAADFKDNKVEPILPNFYNLIFSKVRFVDMYRIYEDIFDRVPMSLVKYNWFLENISVSTKKTYDFLKRLMDISVSFVAGLVSLVFYPFVFTAIKLEDRGPIFITQERIGKNNKIIKVVKFRSMTTNDQGEYSQDIAKNNKITRVGNYLRKFRIDELPQLWNVLKGDLSLIGPRPELPALASHYEKEIPYYNIRHLIKPGLSGWAQLYQRKPPKGMVDLDETRLKLSYDLYYLKNCSLMLDLKIALKTIKTLLSSNGI